MTYDGKGYIELNESEINAEYEKIIKWWKMFLKENDPNLKEDEDYFVHKRNLYEVIRRCDKREYYYFVYHKTEKICEYKRVALQAFWINTLKPFMVVNKNCDIYNCPNEMFSLFLILSIIQKNFKNFYPQGVFSQPSDERIRDIIYDFKYCGLSREAMISFVETFADTYSVGIEKIFEKKRVAKQ